MKFSLLIVFSLAIVLSHCTDANGDFNPIQLNTEDVLSALKASNFGRSLLDILILKSQVNQKPEMLFDALHELESHLRSQYGYQDEEYSKNMALDQDILLDQAKIIERVDLNIVTYNAEREKLINALAQKNETLSVLAQERDDIVQSINEINNIRAAEKATYENRVKGQDTIIKSISKTADLFGRNALGNEELNQEEVNKILSLLSTMSESLTASIDDDHKIENQVNQQTDEFFNHRSKALDEVDRKIKAVNFDMDQLRKSITEIELTIQNEKTRKASLEDMTRKMIANLENSNRKYEYSKEARDDRLYLVKLLKSKLGEDPQKVQEHLYNL